MGGEGGGGDGVFTKQGRDPNDPSVAANGGNGAGIGNGGGSGCGSARGPIPNPTRCSVPLPNPIAACGEGTLLTYFL